jgi:hypothetical protein
MSEKKKKIQLQNLSEQLAEIVEGLSYTSETDAEIMLFNGRETEFLSRENFLSQINKTNDIKIEEKSFSDFFRPLVKFQDWFGEEERKTTEKFIKLKELLQQNLIQKKVFRIGKKEIDIYVVGLDKDNILRGIQTKAVET